jgi:ribose/xylose/arabinose/galactoside ABC-type transport system permease subunit
MARLLRLVTAPLVIAAIVAAAYGAWLVTTADREFAPRGAVGTLSLIVAAVLGGAALAAWRHSQ